ncbi:MAG TPA: exodeoxyribonuclease VII small subunit [Candidatus Megaira endosymbiont of Hartmannula sinica]|nr:exodeoxyribonuclease VII small subunit [Candidatus Megaera endosymbiont of Hartmannula sinica]
MSEDNNNSYKKKENIDKLSFEEAMQELENIGVKIDQENISLDEAVKSFEYGSMLKKHCQKILDSSKLKIEEINNSQ